MSKLTKVMAVVALVLWGLATMHCQLEQVPGFQFIAWCHAQETAPQQSEDCSGDGCSEVESALYKAEQYAVTVPVPVLVVSFLLPLWDVTSATDALGPALLSLAPPELPRVWQFCYRMALPPRAPCLLT